MEETTNKDVTMQWSMADGTLFNFEKYLTPLNLSYLVIDKDAFTPGDSYTFILTVTEQFGQATAQITFDINEPPSGGTLSVTPRVGDEYSTIFSITAVDWSDPDNDATLDYPLLYQFKYINSNQEEIELNTPNRDKEFSTTLPCQPTDETWTYSNVQIVLHVYDQFGSYARTATQVEVALVDANTR